MAGKKADWLYEQEKREFRKAERNKRDRRKGKKDQWQENDED